MSELYSEDAGRPSLDPVVLFKIAFIQYLFGIRSMRQTIKEIETNIAYRWFLGFGLSDEIPHFTSFGKNYARRFEGTEVFEHVKYLNKPLSRAMCDLEEFLRWDTCQRECEQKQTDEGINQRGRTTVF